MTTFSPKDHYLKHHAEICAAFRAIHASQWFSVTLDYALSELGWRGASAEETAGARKYIDLLMTIHEPQEKVKPRMPEIRLESNEQPEQS